MAGPQAEPHLKGIETPGWGFSSGAWAVLFERGRGTCARVEIKQRARSEEHETSVHLIHVRV